MDVHISVLFPPECTQATVTHSEMVEHAFYQALNLVQILGLHAMERASGAGARGALLLLQTAPWAVRARFPVNRFSDNYTKGQDAWALLPLLYRVKKYQYLLYKHWLLHGLNVSVALSPGVRPGAFSRLLTPHHAFSRLLSPSHAFSRLLSPSTRCSSCASDLVA